MSSPTPTPSKREYLRNPAAEVREEKRRGEAYGQYSARQAEDFEETPGYCCIEEYVEAV